MRSMIMGEVEKKTTPIVEKLRSPALIGASITLTPSVAKATADNIERLAQEIDNINAKARHDRQYRWMIYTIVASLAVLCWLANTV